MKKFALHPSSSVALYHRHKYEMASGNNHLFSLSTNHSHLFIPSFDFDITGYHFLFPLFSVQVLLLEKEQQHLDKTQNWRRRIDPLVFWVSSAEDKLNTQFAIAPDLDTVKKQKAELEVLRNNHCGGFSEWLGLKILR